MYLDVTFDPEITDAEGLSDALATLLETAMSTPGILDECGNPTVGSFSFEQQSYLLKTDAEKGITYCRDRDQLLAEMMTVIDAYEHNGDSPENAIQDMQVAILDCNHGVLEPAKCHVKIVRDESNDWSIE